MQLVLFIWLIISLYHSGLGNEEVIINTNNGKIRGLKMISEGGNNYYSFRGIPYAESPIGNLRFKAPVDKAPWGDNILDATEDGPVCPQIDFLTHSFIGEEDNCLILNVYTPQLSNDNALENKAVMIFIHGGGFNFGMGSSNFYNVRSLIDKDIIIVTINYRLGPLGFLSTADELSPGNYGLLDQNKAFEWVNKNIAAFGGDSKRVTIFGESAGGASVTYHILSPMSKGLFNRAIAMSGSSLCVWAFQDNPLIRAQMLGIKLPCPIYDNEKLLECLREESAENITKHGYSFNNGFLPIVFAPTVDNNFLKDKPTNLLSTGDINKDFTFMSGITKDEGAMCYATLNPNSSALDENILREALKDIAGVSIHTEMASKLIRERYLRGADITHEKYMRKKLTEIYSHGLFDKCHYETTELISKSGIETFAYQYDYSGSFSSTQAFGIKEIFGVSHFDDMYMVFDDLFMPVNFTEKDKIMKSTYQTLLTNFAKYGHPTTKSEFLQWNPVKENQMIVYHIDDPIRSDVHSIQKDDLHEFWVREIPEAMTRRLTKAKDEL